MTLAIVSIDAGVEDASPLIGVRLYTLVVIYPTPKANCGGTAQPPHTSQMPCLSIQDVNEGSDRPCPQAPFCGRSGCLGATNSVRGAASAAPTCAPCRESECIRERGQGQQQPPVYRVAGRSVGSVPFQGARSTRGCPLQLFGAVTRALSEQPNSSGFPKAIRAVRSLAGWSFESKVSGYRDWKTTTPNRNTREIHKHHGGSLRPQCLGECGAHGGSTLPLGTANWSARSTVWMPQTRSCS